MAGNRPCLYSGWSVLGLPGHGYRSTGLAFIHVMNRLATTALDNAPGRCTRRVFSLAYTSTTPCPSFRRTEPTTHVGS